MLTIFFLVSVVLIPGYFYHLLSAKRRDIGGILPENRELFMELVDGELKTSTLPGILAQGKEFADMKFTDDDLGAKRSISELGHEDMIKDSSNPKALLLILAYLNKTEEEWLARNNNDLKLILKTIPSYLDLIIDICLDLVRMAKVGQTKKTITCKNLLYIMKFS